MNNCIDREGEMGKKKATVAERYITVCGETCRVVAYQERKSVWSASGDFKRRHITTKGGTASDAFNRWESKVNSQEFN